MMNCSACDAQVSPDDRFCARCGSSLAVADEERRVVSVLFADVVGFTSLAERLDPEEVKRLVDRWFKRLTQDITSFGGVVDKVIGDAIVALFGAPVAHEDDAERAVRAALAMQRSLEDLSAKYGAVEMRIGINTGQVLVGTSTGGDYTAIGDVMNSAARLQGLAKPGQTLVGQHTYAATKDAVSYQSGGMLKAKGRQDLLETWVAIETTRPPGTYREREGAFVGRDNELELLMAQGKLAVSLNQSQLAVVVGEAGMGKTRVVEEATRALAERYRALVVQGRCVPYGVANVWWPLAGIFRQIFGLELDQPLEQVQPLVRKQLDGYFGDDNPQFERYFTGVLHVLGYDTSLRGGDRQRNRSEVMLTTSSLFARILEDRPLVVSFSDVHWATEAIWLLLDHLLAELSQQPLVVFMSAREIDAEALRSGHHGVSIFNLGPLDETSSHRLLDSVAPDLPDNIAAELVRRAGGNPLFLEELAGLVTAKGGANGERPSSEFGGDRLAELPDSLRGIVAARVDELDGPERAVLEDASVLGSSGRIRHLQVMSDQSRGAGDISSTLERLQAKGFLALNGSRYSFKSDVVRDVAYGTITKAVRAGRHYDIAEYLASVQSGSIRNSVVVAIADHYRAAAELSSGLTAMSPDRLDAKAKALIWLGQAGERALAVDEPVEAAKWYSFGIAMASAPDTLADFLYGRARARCEIHDVQGARADLDRLDGLSTSRPLLAAKALLVRGDADRKAGDPDSAASRLREAADRLGGLHETTLQALALRLLGLAEMRRLDGSLARQALEASRVVAANSNDKNSEAWALQSLAWLAFNYGRTTEAKKLVDEAVGIFVDVGDRGGLMWSKSIDAWVAFHQGRSGDAQKLVDEVLPETRRRGDPWSEGLTLNLAASLKLWSGQAAEAHDLAQLAIEVAQRSEDANLVVQSRSLLGRALVSLGRLTEGIAALDEAYVYADRLGSHEGRRLAVVSNCASAARLGEPDRCLRWAERYSGTSSEPAVVGEADLMVSWALANLQRGELDLAVGRLQWVDSGERQAVDYNGLATGAILDASLGDVKAAEAKIDKVLIGRSTYLDRVFALLAWACTKYQTGDRSGCRDAIAAAYEELKSTDDQTTQLVIGLAAAVCGLGELEVAERQIHNKGLDPSGWRTAWELAISPHPAKGA